MRPARRGVVHEDILFAVLIQIHHTGVILLDGNVCFYLLSPLCKNTFSCNSFKNLHLIPVFCHDQVGSAVAVDIASHHEREERLFAVVKWVHLRLELLFGIRFVGISAAIHPIKFEIKGHFARHNDA